MDAVAGLAVNDVFVLDAWGKSQNAGADVMMLADGNGDFTRALGLEMDAKKFGMGERAKRFSLVAKDGVVESLNVEDGGDFKAPSADYMLAQL